MNEVGLQAVRDGLLVRLGRQEQTLSSQKYNSRALKQEMAAHRERHDLVG